jgi:hypothetical protein
MGLNVRGTLFGFLAKEKSYLFFNFSERLWDSTSILLNRYREIFPLYRAAVVRS